MLNLYKYKNALDNNKAFRDSELKRLSALRREYPFDFNTQNMCNLIINYIYDLNWNAIKQQNKII